MCVHRQFRERCGRQAFGKPFRFLYHCTVSMGLPSLGISQQLFFFSPVFGDVQKDFTVSEEVCPPTLYPVLSVSLLTTLAFVELIFIIRHILPTIYVIVRDTHRLYGFLFLGWFKH